MSLEITGFGFMSDAAATVPFFREGDIPDVNIIDVLRQYRRLYEDRGAIISEEEWRITLKHYGLNDVAEVSAPISRIDAAG